MKVLRIIVLVVLVLAAVVFALGGPGALITRLNLLGEQRFTVGEQVYGLAQISLTQSRLEVSLTRSIPAGDVDESDVEAIAAVEGIVLEDSAGARLPVDAVTRASGGGAVVLAFDVTGHTGPWTLEWPGHDPYVINM